ncbi:hypothetical protein [Saccharothrix sp.]|uniref:hypothetical protein n=1 Tax=Saccharothrix sp. TaxID=1873460 RepID=UPI002810F8F6|nr:hypothetical protein [Saccharothrix sp.]
MRVRIAVFSSTNDGVVLDVEPGCTWPPELAPGWVRMRRRAGVDPTVYCNLSHLGALRAAFDAAGVPQPHYWVARYDGRPEIPAGTVAKQYADDKLLGKHYDMNAVADYWPGVDGDDFMSLKDQLVTYNGEPMTVEQVLKYLESAVREIYVRLTKQGNDQEPGGLPAATGERWTSGSDLLVGAHAHAKWADQGVGRLEVKFDALRQELSDDEVKILTAVRAIERGELDAEQLLAALEPKLPAALAAGLRQVIRDGVGDATNTQEDPK